MLRMLSYFRRPQSGQITCYLYRTYHVLLTSDCQGLDNLGQVNDAVPVYIAQLLGRNGETMAASVWSGYLTFGLISMPVRLFSGARGNHISFHMLHRDDNTRIKQQLWCPHDERVVERNEIVKGYEYRKGE